MRCQALRNIPETKLKLTLASLENTYKGDELLVIKKAYHKYYESNIPVKYWALEMHRDFGGDPDLLKHYKELITDIPKLYSEGLSIIYAGGFGRGKTMVATNVLKRAIEKGYSGLYVGLNDVISSVSCREKFEARKELLETNFLVIDEFDSRHMATTDTASDFFGRVVEDVLRIRLNNQMPLILCTNNINIISAFRDSLQESLASLMNYMKIIPVVGEDYRKIEKQRRIGE
jgi:DNA replication protein DnaC